MKKILIFFILIAIIPMLICGILLMVFGATNFSSIETLQYQPVLLTIMILGAIIFLLTLLGCFGAIWESYCMSMTYTILLFTLIIIALASVIFRDKLLVIVNCAVDEAWDERYKNSYRMDFLQNSMECCGKVQYTDYTNRFYYPSSCCNEGFCKAENVYKVGCKEAIANFWHMNFNTFKYPVFVFAVIEFALSLFAGYMTYRGKTKVGRTIILSTTSKSAGKA